MNNKNKDFNKKYSLSHMDSSYFKRVKPDSNSLNNISGKPLVYWKDTIKRFMSNKFAVIALVIIVGIILTAIIVPYTTLYSPTKPISAASSVLITNLPPHELNGGSVTRSIYDASDPLIKLLKNAGITNYKIDSSNIHAMTVTFNPWKVLNQIDGIHHRVYLGTDAAGMDIWTRLWYGARGSLKLAIAVATTEAIIGIMIGAYIGFHAGSTLDSILMRFIDVMNSVPPLIWFIILMFILPAGFWSMFIALVVIGWMPFAFSARMFILRVKDEEYIKSAKSIGVSKLGLIYRHALPNIIGKLLMQFVRVIPRVIFIEAMLSFLGLSADPTAPTLGNLLNQAKSHIDQWWYLLAPTALLMVFTISMQLVAVALHDAFDPKTGGAK